MRRSESDHMKATFYLAVPTQFWCLADPREEMDFAEPKTWAMIMHDHAFEHH